jgi:hypothetical protein
VGKFVERGWGISVSGVTFAHVDAIVDDDGELAGAIQHAF